MKGLKKMIQVLVVVYLLGMVGLYFIQERLLFFPTSLPEDYNYHFPYEFEELDIEVEGGITLNMLLFKAPESKGVVLFFHGNGGAIDSWGHGAGLYIENGYDVLYVDYRGYGKSDGRINSESQLIKDSQEVYEYLKIEYGEDNIIVSGTSIGSGIAARIAYKNSPRQLVLNSPYSSLVRLIREKVPIVPGMIVKYKLETEDIIDEIDMPVAIFHGSNDGLISPSHALRLKEINPQIQLHILDGYGHNDLSQSASLIREMGQLLR